MTTERNGRRKEDLKDSDSEDDDIESLSDNPEEEVVVTEEE